MTAEENKEPEIVAEPAQDASAEEAKTVGAADVKLKEEMLYLRADLENTRRRLIRDQENSIRFANEKIWSEILGVVDLFERALSAAGSLKTTGSDEAKSFYTGIEMTHRELVHLMTKNGVELTGAVGEKFNPAQHEAVAQSPVAADKVDTVTAVAQRGCTFQGRLLKPAKVVVGIAKD